MSRLIIDGYRPKHALKRCLVPAVFRDSLLACGPYDVTIDEIEKWTMKERAQIFDFVLDQHYSAGDHIVRNKRPRPLFFKHKE